MERRTGTISRGIRCPIIREGDDLSVIVTESVLEAAKCENFELSNFEQSPFILNIFIHFIK